MDTCVGWQYAVKNSSTETPAQRAHFSIKARLHVDRKRIVDEKRVHVTNDPRFSSEFWVSGDPIRGRFDGKEHIAIVRVRGPLCTPIPRKPLEQTHTSGQLQPTDVFYAVDRHDRGASVNERITEGDR